MWYNDCRLIGGMVMKKFSKLLCVIMMAIVLVVPFANVNAAKTTKKTTTTTTKINRIFTYASEK